MALSRPVLSVLLVLLLGTVVVNCELDYDSGYRRNAYDDYGEKDRVRWNDFVSTPSPSKQNKLDDYFRNWGWNEVKKDDFMPTTGPWNWFGDSYQGRNEEPWDDYVTPRAVKLVLPPEMQAAMLAAVWLSVILTLVLAVVVLKSFCALLFSLCKACTPESRILLKPARFANHDEKIQKKMSSPEKKDLIEENAANDRTQLKKDFVSYYSC